MPRMRNPLTITFVIMMMLSSLAITAPVAAEGTSHLPDGSCNGNIEPWPNQKRLDWGVYDNEDGTYTAYFDFHLTQAEIDAMACVASNVEVDFHLSGFNIPEGWSDYTFISNMPDKFYDATVHGQEAFLRSTGAAVIDLVPQQQYHVEVTFWNVEPTEGLAEVSLEWVPGEWLEEDCGQNLVYFGDPICRTRDEEHGAILGVYSF